MPGGLDGADSRRRGRAAGAELIAHLGGAELDADRRARAERVLIDLLEPLRVATIELRMPRDPRALDVASALVGDPASRRTLGQWGREGGSQRALAARATSPRVRSWRRTGVSGYDAGRVFPCLVTNTLLCVGRGAGVPCEQGRSLRESEALSYPNGRRQR